VTRDRRAFRVSKGSEAVLDGKSVHYNKMAKKTTKTAHRETRGRGAKDVALVPADELAGLEETAYLLRSPKNARRLLTALRRGEKAEKRVGQTETSAP